MLASQLPHQQVVLVTPRLAAHAFLPFDLLKGHLTRGHPACPAYRGVEISHPISHRTPHYRMGKDGIDWLIAIKKRPNFRTQRDSKIQDDIDGNSLGNRWLSYRKGESRRQQDRRIAISEALIAGEPASWDARKFWCDVRTGSLAGIGRGHPLIPS